MKIRLFILLCMICSQAMAQISDLISQYKVSYTLAEGPAERLVGIRSFNKGGQKYLLLVDPKTLDTKIEPAKHYTLSAMALGNVMATFKTSAYVRALEASLSNGNRLQDAGMDYPIPMEKGIALTIDLCPSKKPLDKIIFTDLLTEFTKVQTPVPVAISVSGKWMLRHENDLEWLKEMAGENRLNITWVNHSYHHKVNNMPLSQNFMLSKNTDINTEVLDNEVLMLRNGLVPSVFFRFPGLVSDLDIIERITGFGLITVGSDAWLAKGQHPGNGSIVLIHGNGNEEIGVDDFIKLLQQKKLDIKTKQWSLFDLRQGLEEEFE